MVSSEASAAFFGVSVLLALAPGRDNLFVLVHSALYGWKTGMLVVLGLCTGLLVHTAAVALGLAAVLAASQTAFTLVKLAGAAYLVVLAWQAFRARAPHEARTPAPSSHRRMYVRGILMNVTNPKVAVFFLSFLPQFVDARQGAVVAQTAWLGFLFIVATLVTFGAIACFSSTIGAVLKRSAGVQRALNRIAGIVFLALAARLATSSH